MTEPQAKPGPVPRQMPQPQDVQLPAAPWLSDDVPPVGTAFGWKSHKGVDDGTYQRVLVAQNWSDAQRLTEDEWDAAIAQDGAATKKADDKK